MTAFELKYMYVLKLNARRGGGVCNLFLICFNLFLIEDTWKIYFPSRLKNK